jgi:hypothetical protein
MFANQMHTYFFATLFNLGNLTLKHYLNLTAIYYVCIYRNLLSIGYPKALGLRW